MYHCHRFPNFKAFHENIANLAVFFFTNRCLSQTRRLRIALFHLFLQSVVPY